jgi:protein-arginine kinase activator protein McsA
MSDDVIEGRFVTRLGPPEPCEVCGEDEADIPYRIKIDGKWGSHMICDACCAKERQDDVEHADRSAEVTREPSG